jgi:hypothetical protein
VESTFREQLAHYQQFRTLQKSLNGPLLEMLPKNAAEKCGKALGIYRDKVMVFGSATEMSVLMEYSLYDYRWERHNVIEQYISQTPLEPGSDKAIFLEAMAKARYSLFRIEAVEKGVGIQTLDLFRRDNCFVIDIGLSETAIKNMVLAGRIINLGDNKFSMTTGASLPVDRYILERIIREIPKRFGNTEAEIAGMSPERAAEFSAAIIRICLEGDAASHMGYDEKDAVGKTIRDGPKIGRNEPCPCGSGKKYKKCCGRML